MSWARELQACARLTPGTLPLQNEDSWLPFIMRRAEMGLLSFWGGFEQKSFGEPRRDSAAAGLPAGTRPASFPSEHMPQGGRTEAEGPRQGLGACRNQREL